MRSKKAFTLIAVFLFLFLSLNSVSAQQDPVFQTISYEDRGISIDYPKFEAFQEGQNFTLNIGVYNKTDGLKIENADCNVSVFNHDGEKVLNESLAFGGGEYSTNVSQSQIDPDTSKEPYTFRIYCEADNIGGFASGLIYISNSGHLQSDSESISQFAFVFVILVLMITFGFIGFRLTDSDELWVLGVFFIFISLLMSIYASWIAVDLYTNYVGAAATGSLPEILFYILLGSIGVGLAVAFLLLLKRIPEFVGKIFSGVVGREDGWDRGAFDKA